MMLRILKSSVRLRELDATLIWRVNEAQWVEVLSHPTVQQHLRSLHFGKGLTESIMRTVAQLPSLHTFTLSDLVASSAWRQLSSCPSLTRLDLLDSGRGGSASPLPGVRDCPHLTHLGLTSPSFFATTFLPFCSSPHLRRNLQSLRLSLFSLHNGVYPLVSLSEFQSGFFTLESLHSLHLVHCFGVDQLLPALPHARALRRLVIEPSCAHRPRIQASSSVPSISLLAQLLADKPDLQCVLLL